MRQDLSLARRQIDRKFKHLTASTLTRPASGWIRAIRQSLGMTTAQLADRMRVSQPRIVAIERSEANAAINVRTLQRAAEALNCTLVYAFIPNEPLEDQVRRRALRVAADRLSSVRHTMRLENQEVADDQNRIEVHELAADLARRAPTSLWSDSNR